MRRDSKATSPSLRQEAPEITSHEVILKLFDGALRQVRFARGWFEHSDLTNGRTALCHAIAIIDQGLKYSLDHDGGGETARSLSSLYSYLSGRLLMAVRRADPEILDEVESILTELRSGWASLGR